MVEDAKRVFLGFSNNDTNDNYNTRYEPPKNWAYYFSTQRCFKISRRHYPQYTRGYLYGYYTDEPLSDASIKKNSDGSIERDF